MQFHHLRIWFRFENEISSSSVSLVRAVFYVYAMFFNFMDLTF